MIALKTRWIAGAVLAACMGMTASIAQAADEVSTPAVSHVAQDYGQLYLLDQREDISHRFELGAGFGYEFSNAYYNVYSFTGDVGYNLSRIWMVGLRFNKYAVSSHDLSGTLTKDLGASDAPRTVLKPDNSYYGLVTLRPFAGHLNFLNRSTSPIALLATLGAGNVRYNGGENVFAMLWEMGIEIGLNDTWALKLSFGQEIESPFDSSVDRTEGRIGINVRL